MKIKREGMGVGLARLCEDLLDVICSTHTSCGYLGLCMDRVCFDRIVCGGGLMVVKSRFLGGQACWKIEAGQIWKVLGDTEDILPYESEVDMLRVVA